MLISACKMYIIFIITGVSYLSLKKPFAQLTEMNGLTECFYVQAFLQWDLHLWYPTAACSAMESSAMESSAVESRRKESSAMESSAMESSATA